MNGSEKTAESKHSPPSQASVLSDRTEFKAIVVGARWSDELNSEQFFVVPKDCDIKRMVSDEQYAIEQVIAQTETWEWAKEIAAALNSVRDAS